ncbi:unnamed protein product [Citrullus colocynthis]|uniref:Alpha/beta hydrolase fold-3 domain-containing protein n=1 Tax=Citrullus colocynthis TaxID=252529 RepID=A0ABP0Y0E5_9ROSI
MEKVPLMFRMLLRVQSAALNVSSPAQSDDDSDNLTGLPLLVYYHGGGFAFLSASSMPFVDHSRRLARDLRVVVVSVNYCLSPEHPYPIPYEDGFDAFSTVWALITPMFFRRKLILIGVFSPVIVPAETWPTTLQSEPAAMISRS